MSLGSLQSVISRVDAPSVMIPLDAKLEGVAPLSGVEEEEEDDRPVYENVGRRSRFDFSSLILLSHVGFLSDVVGDMLKPWDSCNISMKIKSVVPCAIIDNMRIRNLPLIFRRLIAATIIIHFMRSRR